MKRIISWFRPKARPVQTIEVPTQHIRLRTVLLVGFFVLAAVAFAVGLSTMLGASEGLQEITVLNANELSCGEAFTFYYDVGTGDVSATEEYKAIRSLYSQLTVDAYALFSADAEYEGVCNLWYLNHHVNEAVEVAPALYQAFSTLDESGARYLYLAPMYEMYQSLFFCSNDEETGEYDPYRNEALREFYVQTAAFAGDRNAVCVELLGNDTVRLSVGEDYLRFGQENGIERWIDLFWLKNAFSADYMADALIAAGYLHGALISNDGFVRGLGDTVGNSFSLEFPHREAATVSGDAALHFSGQVSLVCLRDYPLNAEDAPWYYGYGDGQIRTRYLDPADGLCKSAVPELAVCSNSLSCAETALLAASAFIAEKFDPARLAGSEGTAWYYVDGVLISTALDG